MTKKKEEAETIEILDILPCLLPVQIFFYPPIIFLLLFSMTFLDSSHCYRRYYTFFVCVHLEAENLSACEKMIQTSMNVDRGKKSELSFFDDKKSSFSGRFDAIEFVISMCS